MIAWISLATVIEYLNAYKYVAMFGILFLCGVGLPLPEEVTLIGSGILVGWEKADFLYSSIACVSAILVGDSIIFFLGRIYGQAFLNGRFLRRIFPPKRQEFAREFFNRRRNKAVFFARFFAGLRIGVYAYAGSGGMSWFKFIFLDFLGAMISGPTSIWLGKFAAEKIGGPEKAEEVMRKAQEWSSEFHNWIWIVIGVLALFALVFWLKRRKKVRERVKTAA